MARNLKKTVSWEWCHGYFSVHKHLYVKKCSNLNVFFCFYKICTPMKNEWVCAKTCMHVSLHASAIIQLHAGHKVMWLPRWPLQSLLRSISFHSFQELITYHFRLWKYPTLKFLAWWYNESSVAPSIMATSSTPLGPLSLAEYISNEFIFKTNHCVDTVRNPINIAVVTNLNRTALHDT